MSIEAFAAKRVLRFRTAIPAAGLLPAIALSALIPAAALAAPACGPTATLTTQGTGEAHVQPDMATVSVGVTVQAPTAQAAMTDNAARQQAVIDALRAQGVEPRDIQTSGLNLSPLQDYSREGQPPVITGYQAQNIVTITVRDLGGLGGVLDRLVAAGANEVQGISFGRDDSQATEDEALRKAVENARHTAGILAEAAGLELGGLVSLNNGGYVSPPAPMYRMAAQESAAAGTPIQAGELSFTANVGATFELTGEGAMQGSCGMAPPSPPAAPPPAPPQPAPPQPVPPGPAPEPEPPVPPAAPMPADGPAPAGGPATPATN